MKTYDPLPALDGLIKTLESVYDSSHTNEFEKQMRIMYEIGRVLNKTYEEGYRDGMNSTIDTFSN